MANDTQLEVRVPLNGGPLLGDLLLPAGAPGLVAIVSGQGRGRHGAAERAVATISRASPCSRAARAIEPPIRPKPIRATRLKRGAVLTYLPAMKSRRPSTTRRLASSGPMVMRSECGRP